MRGARRASRILLCYNLKMNFREDDLDPKPANKPLSQEELVKMWQPIDPREDYTIPTADQEELIKEWQSMDDGSDYKVPPAVILEVQEYIDKMKNPDLTREEYFRLLNEMKKKESEDLNYQLARLELTVSEEAKGSKYDPMGSKHTINELRRKLTGEGSGN